MVTARLVHIFALPLDFHERLRVIRTMFIPGALHGIEASFFAETSLRKLRAAVFNAAWSCRQHLACFFGCIVWFRFRMFRRYLAYRPGEVFRVFGLLGSAADGCPGHGPAHLLVESAAEIGFHWSHAEVGWGRAASFE